jgi:hypothetical protein
MVLLVRLPLMPAQAVAAALVVQAGLKTIAAAQAATVAMAAAVQGQHLVEQRLLQAMVAQVVVIVLISTLNLQVPLAQLAQLAHQVQLYLYLLLIASFGCLLGKVLMVQMVLAAVAAKAAAAVAAKVASSVLTVLVLLAAAAVAAVKAERLVLAAGVVVALLPSTLSIAQDSAAQAQLMQLQLWPVLLEALEALEVLVVYVA